MSQQNFYYFSDYFGQSNESNALDSLLKSHLYGLIRMGYLLSNILTLLLLQGRTEYVLFCSDCMRTYALGRNIETHIIKLLDICEGLVKCKTIGENYTKKKMIPIYLVRAAILNLSWRIFG